MDIENTQEIEINLLLKAIHSKYGYDFRCYSLPYIKRYLLKKKKADRFENLSDIQHRILHDPEWFDEFKNEMFIHTTEMFRDPKFFKRLKAYLSSFLSTYPSFKIWHPGCSTGEEAYTMAIILDEMGLLDRATIYASDISEKALEQAKQFQIDKSHMGQYSKNYEQFEGMKKLTEYFEENENHFELKKNLREAIVFMEHNLIADGDPGEMNLIVCRNVFIYFNKRLQNQILKKFHQCLCRYGMLCLGLDESIQKAGNFFEQIDNQYSIYKKKEKILK